MGTISNTGRIRKITKNQIDMQLLKMIAAEYNLFNNFENTAIQKIRVIV